MEAPAPDGAAWHGGYQASGSPPHRLCPQEGHRADGRPIVCTTPEGVTAQPKTHHITRDRGQLAVADRAPGVAKLGEEYAGGFGSLLAHLRLFVGYRYRHQQGASIQDFTLKLGVR
jgi:hypothetical protein